MIAPFACIPRLLTETRVVVAVVRSCTNTSPVSKVSPAMRFDAYDENATKRPSPEIAGSSELRSGIVVQTGHATDLHTLVDARENAQVYRALARGGKPPLLVDMRVTGATENGVREFYGELSSEAGAVAFVIGNMEGRIIGNFYMAMRRPPTPTKLFSDVDAAVHWLESKPTVAEKH